jgi:hypothetical protein
LTPFVKLSEKNHFKLMGLSISYHLSLKSASVAEVRAKVTALRNHALNLPFQEVNELVELQGEECSLNSDQHPDPQITLKLRAAKPAETRIDANDPNSWWDSANYLIGFDAWPGEGSVYASIGLGTHEQIQEVNNWEWRGSCKTQYASDPKCGGWENFQKCHLAVIHLLDEMQKLGIECKVNDGGNYWETRNLEDLAESIGMHNIFMAAVFGKVKDAIAPHGTLKAPITEYQNFEYLEAEGNEMDLT